MVKNKRKNTQFHGHSQAAGPSPNSSVWHPRSLRTQPCVPSAYGNPSSHSYLSLDMPSSLTCPPNCPWAFVYVVPSSKISFPISYVSYLKLLFMCPHLETLHEHLPHTAFILAPIAMLATANIQRAHRVSMFSLVQSS